MDRLREHSTSRLRVARRAALGLAFAATLLSLSACRKGPPTPQLDPARCRQELEDAFGRQDSAVVAVRAADGGPIFRPSVLEALDRVCEAFEAEAVDDAVSVKCATNVPLMEARPGGARLVLPRDELPVDQAGADRLRALLLELEFAVGDVLNGAHNRSFIHIPLASFEGVDLPGLVASLGTSEPELELALDPGPGNPDAAYRALALDGPSATAVWGLLDSGEDGGMKEPATLRALERFQVRAEALPRVAQTFTIADDIKVTRRALRRGNPADAVLPPKRSEVAQLLLAMSMSPSASLFGERLDAGQRVALIKVQLRPSNPEQARRLERRLAELLEEETPEGARALLCSSEE